MYHAADARRELGSSKACVDDARGAVRLGLGLGIG